MSELIVMLTHNDVTVPNALEVFTSCRDLPVKYWGFKDHGLEPAAMKQLVDVMKANEKTTFLEVVSYTEEECMRGARLGVECGFDYLRRGDESKIPLDFDYLLKTDSWQ